MQEAADQGVEQGVRRVQAVFGLVEEDGLGAVDHLGRDFIATVRGQAVNNSRCLDQHRGWLRVYSSRARWMDSGRAKVQVRDVLVVVRVVRDQRQLVRQGGAGDEEIKRPRSHAFPLASELLE